jgi:hypothetical protein
VARGNIPLASALLVSDLLRFWAVANTLEKVTAAKTSSLLNGERHQMIRLAI